MSQITVRDITPAFGSEVQGYDPVALTTSLVVLAAVALIAADGPARRAGRTNLVAALGSD